MFALFARLMVATTTLFAIASNVSAQPFVEASTVTQKVGYQLGNFAPFLAGSVGYEEDSFGETSLGKLHYSVGAGIDYTRKVHDIDLGLRLMGTYLENKYEYVYLEDDFRSNVLCIASKSFGPLSIGGGLGPRLTYSSTGGWTRIDISMASDLFARFRF